jgi:hypothetical protein
MRKFAGVPGRDKKKGETMVVKTDDVPNPIGQRPKKHTQKFNATVRHLPVFRLFFESGLAIIMLFAVLSGWPGLHKNLEKMGVHLGPTHL